jgi:HSP20 family molecular chaperone IbpA
MTTYRSELYIPIKPDDMTFEERQRKLWGDMDLRMEQRRREWESEIEHMRREFFSLKPIDFGSSRMSSIERVDDLRTCFVKGVDGSPRFKVRFDVHEFKPEEISVQTQDKRLVVKARHEERTQNATVTREFSRQVDIPKNVDPKAMLASVTKDGVLIIDAPLTSPDYQMLTSSTNVAPTGSLIESPFSLPMSTSGLGPGIITKPDGTRELRLEIDVGTQYKPEEITVKTVDRKICISARHEEKMGNRTSFSEFSKEYEIPESVDPFTVNAYLTDTGKLIVEAPLQSQQPPTAPPRATGPRFIVTVQRR